MTCRQLPNVMGVAEVKHNTQASKRENVEKVQKAEEDLRPAANAPAARSVSAFSFLVIMLASPDRSPGTICIHLSATSRYSLYLFRP